MPRIEDWAIISNASNIGPYAAPEQVKFALRGKVYDHVRLPDGGEIRTSAIESYRDNIVTTKTGSVYHLGTPHKDYMDWLRENGKSLSDFYIDKEESDE